MAIDRKIKAFTFLSMLLLIPLSSGMVEMAEGFTEGTIAHFSIYKGGVRVINTRKLLLNMQDYDDTGPNPKHDPRKRPGHP